MLTDTVTLVSAYHEVQYVALRNIDLLLQKQPGLLSNEMRVFFCKYNDPPYLKVSKLEIMVRIANESNVDQLLAELKEYAMEVDMDFVRRAIKAISQVAIKIESSSEKAVNVLLELINTKQAYVVQEVIVVIRDIFRRYPGYEGIIPTLCQCIDDLDEPNAKGALIWIVGEYAEKLSTAGDILSSFVDGFAEEETQVSCRVMSCALVSITLMSFQVQLQILTAVVKLFLKKPDQAQGLVQKVLQQATAECDNPDVRDRAYVYWRLLSSDPQVAKVRPHMQQPVPRKVQPLTLIEHHPGATARHNLDNKHAPSSPPRQPPPRSQHPGLRLPQATAHLSRPRPRLGQRAASRRHRRSGAKRPRKPHRRRRRRQQIRGRSRRGPEQRGEPARH